MLYGGLERKELEEVIRNVLERLEKNGLIKISKEEKTNIITKIADGLSSARDIFLNKDDLKNPETLKNISLACVATLNPENKLDWTRLFKESVDLEKNLDEKLKMVLAPMLDKNKLTEENQLKMNDKSKELATAIDKSFHKEDKTALAKQLLAFEIILTYKNNLKKSNPEEEKRLESRVADYGVDTHNPGSILRVLQAVISGNQMQRQFLATSGDNFIGKINDPSLGVEDPFGMKFEGVLNQLKDGVINTASEKDMLRILKDSGFSVYQSPTLTRDH